MGCSFKQWPNTADTAWRALAAGTFLARSAGRTIRHGPVPHELSACGGSRFSQYLVRPSHARSQLALDVAHARDALGITHRAARLARRADDPAQVDVVVSRLDADASGDARVARDRVHHVAG